MWARSLRLTPEACTRFGHQDIVRHPDLVLTFGPTDLLMQGDAFENVRRAYQGAIHVGCSTGTSVSNGALADTGVSVLELGFDNTPVRQASATLSTGETSLSLGRRLGADLAAHDLVGLFVLTDGLSVNGSEIVRGLVDACGPGVTVSGGMAGDGARFADTCVEINGRAARQSAVAVGFYGRSIRLSHGSEGGWEKFGPSRTITRSDGNVLFELDGRPALDLYERYLGDDAKELPASALRIPLRVWNPNHPQEHFVRTILGVDANARTMTFAGDVPNGWKAELMRGAFDKLTHGAASAAVHARTGLPSGTKPDACIFVSCVGRRLLMNQRTQDETRAVAEEIGEDVPMAGFYSYGELAPHNHTGNCGLHNQTATLTLLTEVDG